MKWIVLVFAFTACVDRGPEHLKALDAAKAKCTEACKPREMDSYDQWNGCQCKVTE